MVLNEVGTITVRVSYEGFEKNFTVEVVPVIPVLTDISVTLPSKTEYIKGDALDLTGMSVTAIYSDDSTENVTARAVVIPANGTILNEVGTITVVVSCTADGLTKTTAFIVTVKASLETDNAEFLQERAAGILKNGLSTNNLRLDGKVLTLVIDGREFVLSTNANNRNISGEIALGDGYYLKFDIKGNGSNIKEFKIIPK